MAYVSVKTNSRKWRMLMWWKWNRCRDHEKPDCYIIKEVLPGIKTLAVSGSNTPEVAYGFFFKKKG